MKTCVFCRIAKNEIASKKVYETDLTMVLLAKEMEVYAHTLIIPKQHYKNITDIQTATLADMMDVTKKILLHYTKKI